MDRLTGKMRDFANKNDPKLDIFRICDFVCVFRNSLNLMIYGKSLQIISVNRARYKNSQKEAKSDRHDWLSVLSDEDF